MYLGLKTNHNVIREGFYIYTLAPQVQDFESVLDRCGLSSKQIYPNPFKIKKAQGDYSLGFRPYEKHYYP
jgi:hypothetical protein